MAYAHATVLTGGIATGKSTAAEIFRSLGFEIIDADTIAHEVLASQREPIAAMFGEQVIRDGEVDRKALGGIVFGDELKRRQLEALLHPLIESKIAQQAERLEALARPYLIDIPLFYERDAYPIDRVIVVYAPRDLQIERLITRNTLTRPEALQRLDAQMDIEEKRIRATWVIDNTADQAHLRDECEQIAAKLST